MNKYIRSGLLGLVFMLSVTSLARADICYDQFEDDTNENYGIFMGVITNCMNAYTNSSQTQNQYAIFTGCVSGASSWLSDNNAAAQAQYDYCEYGHY